MMLNYFQLMQLTPQQQLDTLRGLKRIPVTYIKSNHIIVVGIE